MHTYPRYDDWPYTGVLARVPAGNMEPAVAEVGKRGPISDHSEQPADREPAHRHPWPGPQFVSHVYESHLGSREYKVFIPSARRRQSLPLIVMLHGCSQTVDELAHGTRMNELAERFGFIVAYPSQSSCANRMHCWNWHLRTEQQRDLGEPGIIAGITQAVAEDYSVDRRRIYIAGLSAGGAMAAIMGSTYPDLYMAVGIHSGLAHGAAHDLMSAYDAMTYGIRSVQGKTQRTVVPTIVFHGDRDTIVHPANADHLMTQLAQSAREPIGDIYQTYSESVQHHSAQAGNYAYTRTVCTDPHDRIFFEQWLIHGAGHAWSGGSPGTAFADARGPDASLEMLRFFLDGSF